MRRRDNYIYGFTVMELLVVIAILTIIASIAVPSFSALKSQMQMVDDIRVLAGDFSVQRAEAIRMRTFVRFTFTTSGYSWDINNDGSVDGSRTLSDGSQWHPALPPAILINGLGLTRGISSQLTISIKHTNNIASLQINRNGHIQL